MPNIPAKVGVVLDDWKLPIFLRHLDAAGISHEPLGGVPAGTVGLYVLADPHTVARVVTAANAEAAATKKGSPDAN